MPQGDSNRSDQQSMDLLFNEGFPSILGKAVGYQPAGVEMSKGKPIIGGLVLGKAVGYPTGVEMLGRRFGVWEGCRLPTYRSTNVKG